MLIKLANKWAMWDGIMCIEYKNNMILLQSNNGYAVPNVKWKYYEGKKYLSYVYGECKILIGLWNTWKIYNIWK